MPPNKRRNKNALLKLINLNPKYANKHLASPESPINILNCYASCEYRAIFIS